MKPLLSLLAVLALAAPSYAQNADGRTVRIQFRALSFDEPILGATFLEGKKPTRVDISPDMFTQEQTYTGPATLNFYRITLKEVKEEEAPEVTQTNAHVAGLSGKARQLSAALSKLQAEANAMTVRGGENGGGKMSKYDQDKLAEIHRQMDELSKEISNVESDLAKAQQVLANHIQNAQAAKAEADKKKKEDAAKGKGAPAPAAPKKPEAVESSVQIASCSFTESGRYLLLFFKDGEKHRVLVLDDKDNAFPYGSIQYVNLTRKPIQVRYGAKVSEIAANGRAVITSPAPNESYARGEILTPGDDGYQVGFAARTFQQQDVRTLFFVSPVEAEGSHLVQLKGIEERRPPPEAQPDPAANAGKNGKAGAGKGK
jgi:alkylated DNA nucleotide flippase Atl1